MKRVKIEIEAANYGEDDKLKQSEEEIKRSLPQPSMHKAPSKRPNK